jgi:hypothetical protein
MLSDKDEARIHKAAEIRMLAELELVASCLDAMRHGASIAQVAAASGKAERTIIRWRRGQGLPTFDDWHGSARERQRRLYEAHPGLLEVKRMLDELKADKPAGD